MEVTNYFTAQDDELFKLWKLSQIKRGRPKHLGIAPPEFIISKFPIGLWSYTKSMQKYSEIMKECGIDQMSNEEIFKEFNNLMKNYCNAESEYHEPAQIKANGPVLPRLEGDIDLDKVSEALAMYFSTPYSLYEIAFKTKIQKSQLAYYIRYLKQHKRYNDNASSKSDRKRNRKITSMVVEEIKEIISSRQYSQFTISSIQNKFNSGKNEAERISKSTCRKILKTDLNLSYKRWNIVAPQTLTSENMRWYFESAAFLSKMRKERVEVIFFDGFSLDTRKFRFYHWSTKGKPAYLSINDSQFHMSFLIGISKERIYGIMGVKGITNSSVIISYLTELLTQRNKDKNFKKKPFMLWMDNASVHVSESTQKFLSKCKLRAVTIAARWPSLNPAEKLIAWFKALINKQSKSGR